MEVIDRDSYLDRLESLRGNGRVKIITGIRRCGKSFLLSRLYKNRLIEAGVDPSNFIEVALDRKGDKRLRNPDLLYAHILDRVHGQTMHYVFVDEIQMSYRVLKPGVDLSAIAPEDRDLAYTTFYDVLNDLAARENVDVYMTGSNSKMLSGVEAFTRRLPCYCLAWSEAWRCATSR